MATVTIDDFEDGDIVVSGAGWSGWTGDTADFSTTGGIEGSYAGRLEATGEINEVRATRSSPVQRDFELRVDYDTGATDNNNDYVAVQFVNTNDNVVGPEARIEADGQISVGGVDYGTAFSDTIVRAEPNEDGTITVSAGGNSETAPFPVEGVDQIIFRARSAFTSDTMSGRIDSVESFSTPLYTPAAPTVTATRNAEVDLGISYPTDADAVDIYRNQTGAVTTADTLVAADVTGTTYTDTGLENGEEYYYAAVAKDTTGDRPDSNISPTSGGATTTLPAPTIDSSTAASQTAIDIAWSPQDNSTDGDYQVVVNGSVDQTVALGTTTATVTGLSEATAPGIVVRRRTDHTTSDSATDGQHTKPTAPGLNGVVALDGDDITLGVVDNSGGEDGYRALVSTDGGGTFTAEGSAGANASDVTATGLARPETYTLAVQAYVGSGDDEATAESGTVERYLAPSRAPTDAATWKLELQHPNGTAVMVEPTDATFYPRIKALPTLQATLPPDPRWTSGAFVDVSMKAWKDGQRLPIDTCVAIRDDSGGEITLQARGGSELRREANTVIDQKAVHDTVRDLVDGKTNYATNVDDPQAETTTNTRIQSADTLAEWQAIDIDFADDVPLRYPTGGGLLAPAQTCWLGCNDGGNMSAPSGNFTEESDGQITVNNWEDADVIRLEAQGEYVEWTFNVDHRIPASEVGVAWRREYESGSGQIPFIVELDDITIFDFDVGGDIADINWSADFGTNFGVSLSPANNPHTLRFTIDGPVVSSAYYRIDIGSVFDKRYHTLSNFPNQIITDQSDPGYTYLPGPRSAPDEIAVTTTDAIPPVSASGARVEVDIGSTYGAKRIELSGDQGQTYPISATDTESVEGDFGSLVGQVRSRITLGAQGEGQSDTPVDGYARPELLAYDVFADLDDTALFISENFQGSILDVLQRGADYDDAIWEVQWDADAGSQSLEWTRPGQRQAIADASLSDYEWEETAEERYDRVRVTGRSIPVADEVITADHGTAVALANSPLKPDSETVEAGGTQYVGGQDYTVDYEAGTLTTLASGNITDGDALAVSYEWQPLGSADRAGASAPYTVRQVALPGLSSDRECEIAARRIRDATDNPLIEAEVTLPPDEIGLTAIDNLQFSDLPSGDYLDVNEITADAGSQVARLGSRESVQDFVSDLERKVSSTAENA